MKKILLRYLTCLLAGLVVTACKYDTDIPNPGEYVRVYMPQAADALARRTFSMADTLQTIYFGAAYGGPNSPESPVEVRFEARPDLVEAYNTANGTDYAAMPAGSYQLTQTSATIAAGELYTRPLKIKVKTSGALEPFKPYLLPVTIKEVSGQLALNEELRTAYFLVEGQRAGITLKVMSLGKGSGVHNMAPVADIINAQNPDLVLVREMDLNTVRNGKKDQAADLAQLIGMPHYLFIPSIASFDGGSYGATIFSRYPITEQVTHLLPTGDTNTEKGPLGIVTVQVDATHKLVFAGTHLNANATRRAAQLPELVRIVNTYTTDPLVLAGNFNDRPPAGPVYAALAGTGLRLPCATCPANTPLATPTNYSDFTLYKSDDQLRVLSHSVGATSTSAHLPVITQLQLYID